MQGQLRVSGQERERSYGILLVVEYRGEMIEGALSGVLTEDGKSAWTIRDFVTSLVFDGE